MEAEMEEPSAEIEARKELLESLDLQFPSEENVTDEELAMYTTMMENANVLIEECLKLRKQLERSNTKVRKLGAGGSEIASEERGDVVFKLKGELTRAHSTVVSAWSDPLSAMLQSGMREEREKCIEITTEHPAHVREMLRYFYTCCAEIGPTTVFPLLRLSCLYAVDTLRDECCEYLLNNISRENCVEILNMANLHQFEHEPIWDDLQFQANSFYVWHIPEIVSANSSPFRGMDMPRIIEYVDNVLENMKKCDSTEIEAVEVANSLSVAVANWARDRWAPVHSFPHVIMHLNSEIALHKIQLFVKISGNTLSVFIKKTSNVYDLKVELEKTSGIPIAVQRLTFEGKHIADTDSLTECGIMPDCTVHLSVTQFPPKKKSPPEPKGDPEPPGDLENLTKMRDLCIAILVYDLAAQSRTLAFLELDFETILSIIKHKCPHEIPDHSAVVLAATCTWIHASEHRNTDKIVSKLIHSSNGMLEHLKDALATKT